MQKNKNKNKKTAIDHFFSTYDKEGKNRMELEDLLQVLKDQGFSQQDPRLKNFFIKMEQMKRIKEITKEELELLIQYQRPLFEKIFKEELVIPEFKIFTQEIKKIYDQVQKNQEGQVADYIPQLKKISPDNFALSLCTLDGQSFSLGNSNQYFSLQSISKTLNYCLALEDYGENFVHDHVGREPSGHGFNEITLDKNKRPHNPFVNAGAIMINSMVRPELEPAERFDHVMSMWKKSSAGEKTSFNNSVYLSERDSADRNFALAYFMKENNSFPKNTDILETLEFYFRCCSIEHTTHAMSIFGATLANAGFCPLTNENVFHPNTVRNCLSLMSSCGMYDFSGEFFFSIGLPAKSGVGGGLLIVIPNLMGVCLWSPALDTLGNTVKGIEFCKHLVSKYNFHHFDSLTTRHPGKINPRLKRKGKKK
jgi:glutaminase